jgi:hypothetical protein
MLRVQDSGLMVPKHHLVDCEELAGTKVGSI